MSMNDLSRPSVADAIAWDALTPEQQAAARNMLTEGVNADVHERRQAFRAGWTAACERIGHDGPDEARAFVAWNARYTADRARRQ